MVQTILAPFTQICRRDKNRLQQEISAVSTKAGPATEIHLAPEVKVKMPPLGGGIPPNRRIHYSLFHIYVHTTSLSLAPSPRIVPGLQLILSPLWQQKSPRRYVFTVTGHCMHSLNQSVHDAPGYPPVKRSLPALFSSPSRELPSPPSSPFSPPIINTDRPAIGLPGEELLGGGHFCQPAEDERPNKSSKING